MILFLTMAAVLAAPMKESCSLSNEKVNVSLHQVSSDVLLSELNKKIPPCLGVKVVQAPNDNRISFSVHYQDTEIFEIIKSLDLQIKSID